MEILKTAVLGIVQGLTEFLPVSSSGHLVIVEKLLGFRAPSIFFEVLVHLATILAVIIVFAKDLGRIASNSAKYVSKGFKTESDGMKNDVRLVFLVILASIPTAIMGLLFKERIEDIFHTVKLVGGMLILTGLILIMSKVNQEKCHKGVKETSSLEAILIGIAQGFAIMPGISRSGITISLGMLQKLDRDFAAKFSFYLSIPAVLGASLLKALDLTKADLALFPTFLPGFIAALIFGILAIRILMKHIVRGKFYLYSIWCFIVGSLVLAFM